MSGGPPNVQLSSSAWLVPGSKRRHRFSTFQSFLVGFHMFPNDSIDFQPLCFQFPYVSICFHMFPYDS